MVTSRKSPHVNELQAELAILFMKLHFCLRTDKLVIQIWIFGKHFLEVSMVLAR